MNASFTILILTNSSSGLYDFRGMFISKLIQSHSVLASTPDSGNISDLTSLGCQIISTALSRRGINPVTDFKLFLTYLGMLRKVRPDLVITYTIKPNVYGGFACRLLRIPYAANITGLGTAFQGDGLLRKLVSLMYRFSLKRAKVVFFENEGNRQTLLKEGVVREEQTCLLAGAGVNLERFVYVPYPAEDETTRFLFIGRVMREKGIDELFAAMERLRSEGVDCCLDVLGGYEENYAETIRRCEEQGWLHYHGYVTDVRPYIEKAHCFVLPSYHEGMANTNLECAASGRPVITSNIPGCKEAVLEGVSGLLCEPKDAGSLYEAMKHFCALSAEQRAEMGRAGREHMVRVFDKRKVVEMTMRGLGL